MHHPLLVAATLGLFTGLLSAEEGTTTPSPPPQRPDFFNTLDLNKDGKVTETEFVEYHSGRIREQFKRTDLDQDGSVTKEELKQGREQMRNAFKKRMENHPGNNRHQGRPGSMPPPPPRVGE
ncbi:MAG: EF-hand domain-containing protein [Gammaproteobacteria bacterium]|nr:EF-hand domain-containing protein [Gammaproteobacteria bacterium]